MKTKLIILFFLSISYSMFAQVKTIKRKDITDIHKDWVLIKTISGTYGIMSQNGKMIVQPTYAKIDRFGVFNKNMALVKNVSDTYGFIDTSGKEVIPAQYALEEIKTEFPSLYKKYISK